MPIARMTAPLLALMLLSACVTINIYFPSAQAEEAAEKIIDDIIRQQQPPPADAAEPQARASGTLVLGLVLDFVIPPAQAAGMGDFEIDTPEIRRLRAQLKQRYAQLAPYFDAGAVGLTNDGLVALRDAGAVGLKQRAGLKRLIEGENQDRNALYRAIAEANGHPEWEPEVRRTFAEKWIEKARPGWWYQTDGGSWRQAGGP